MPVDAGTAFITFRPDLSGLEAELQRAVKPMLSRLGDSFVSVGKTMTKAVTLPLLAFGAAGVKAAIDVDKGLREVNTLFGLTGKAAESSFKELKGGVAGLSKEIGVAQDVLVKGLYQAISAGVPRENAFTFMQVAAKAAIAGVTDTKTAVDGLTTIINAFGLKASDAARVADSMFTAVKGGKCVVGSTRVLLADGRYERIDALQAGAEVVSFDGRNFVPMRAAWIDQGVKETVRVRTRLGRSIVTTWNHPYLTTDGWRKVSDLNPGDRIAVPTSTPFFGRTQVDPEWAAFLGLWLAEGSCSASSPRLTTTRYGEEATVWAKALGCGTRQVERREGRAPVYEFAAGSRGSGVPNAIQARLRASGLDDCTSASKHVPPDVFGWERESLALFLRWLFNGDGWLTDLRPQGRSGFEVGFVSKSERLVRDVSHLLLRFGIVGTIRDRGNCWVWSAKRYQEVARFVQAIGIDRPAAALVEGHVPKKQRASWGVVEFDPIVEIAECGAEHVYDLTVPVLANFVADDIVAHNTTFGELSAALFNVAPAAAAAGVSMEEVNAAIATLTAAGVPTSIATTQIRAALVGLQRPSEEMDAIFQKLGFKNAQLAIESKGLAFALDAVKDAAAGDTGKLQTLLGSVEAVAAANVIAGTGAGKMAQELDNQAKKAGSTQTAFQEMEKSVGRKIDRLKTNFVNLSISVGNALLPIVEKVGAAIGKVVAFFQGLSPEMKRFVGSIVLAAAAFGPILFAVGKVIKIFAALKLALTANPWGILIASVVALAIIIVSNWNLIRDAVVAAMTFIVDKTRFIWEPIAAFFKLILDGIKLAFTTVWGAIDQFIRPLWEAWKAVAEFIFNALKAYFEFVLEAYKTIFVTAWNVIKAVVVPIWEVLKATAEVIFTALKVAIEVILTALRIVWESVWGAIKLFVIPLWNAIWEAAKVVFNAIKTVIEVVMKAIQAIWGPAWEAIKTVVGAVWGVIKTVVGGAINAVKTVIETVINVISGIWQKVWVRMRDFVMGIWEGIKTAIKGAINFLIDLINGLIGGVNAISGALSKLPGVDIPKIPEIPKLAKGGIVDDPTLAFLGEGRSSEAVLPLPKLEELIKMAGGTTPGAAPADRNMTIETGAFQVSIDGTNLAPGELERVMSNSYAELVRLLRAS